MFIYMSKISIKKNIGPTKKQKQKQTQKQSVVVNIGAVGKTKRRTRQPTRQKQPTTQPTFAPTFAPSFFNRLPNQSLLATPNQLITQQEKPKVLVEEVKEQSALTKAIQEQNDQTAEPVVKVNDLEKVRVQRVKKFEPSATPVGQSPYTPVLSELSPVPLELSPRAAERAAERAADSAIETAKLYGEEEPIRRGLLGQVLSQPSERTDETLGLLSQRKEIPYSPSGALSSLGFTFSRAPVKGSIIDVAEQAAKEEEAIAAAFKGRRGKEFKSRQALLGELKSLQAESLADEALVEAQKEIRTLPPLRREPQRGAAELVIEDIGQSPYTPLAIAEPTPLTKQTSELGFGGLTEEPIQTDIAFEPPEPEPYQAEPDKLQPKPKVFVEPSSVGEFLPIAPVSQTGLSILEAQQPPPPLLAQSAASGDSSKGTSYVTERLVKEDIGPPHAEARVLESRTEKTQIKELWDQLIREGKLTASSKIDDRSRNKTRSELLADINTVSGYEGFKPVKQEVKNTGKSAKKAAATLDV